MTTTAHCFSCAGRGEVETKGQEVWSRTGRWPCWAVLVFSMHPKSPSLQFQLLNKQPRYTIIMPRRQKRHYVHAKVFLKAFSWSSIYTSFTRSDFELSQLKLHTLRLRLPSFALPRVDARPRAGAHLDTLRGSIVSLEDEQDEGSEIQ